MRFGEGNFVRGDNVMQESATKGLGWEGTVWRRKGLPQVESRDQIKEMSFFGGGHLSQVKRVREYFFYYIERMMRMELSSKMGLESV